MKSFICILACLLIETFAFEYTCAFGELPENHKRPQPWAPPNAESFSPKVQQGRRLQTLTRSPFRITLDTTDMVAIKPGANGAANPTTAQLNFLVRAMQVTERFYELRLKVSQASRVFAPNTPCVDFTPSSDDTNNGIAASDIHIYVRYLADKGKAYGATGKSCNYITGGSSPDTTLQQGRPSIGRIIFNTHNIFYVTETQSYITVFTNRLFASTVSTSLHQVLHILGFDSSLFGTYLDTRTGANFGYPYNQVSTGSGPTTNQVTLALRTLPSYLLLTPNVVAWAKDFYACPSITGMQLENQDGGSPGSHWERLVMYDQLMTGTTLGAQKGFSGLTYALISDMGWYEVDATFNDTTNYGYHKGCSFYNSGCYGASFPESFCDATALSGISKCATDFLGKAICTSQSAVMADGCGIFASYFNCVDPAEVDDGYRSYTLEQYGTSVFCIQSTLSNTPLSPNLLSRCYPYTCFASNTSIVFSIASLAIVCQSSQAGTTKTLSGMSGYLQCPVYDDFCTVSRKICKNWCSQNGFCTRGICNCLLGFSGEDCSVTTCTNVQFWSPGANNCVTSCPSGTYANKYSRTCMPCQLGVCGQCRDQPQICTGCPPSTPPKVFYQSTCISVCPSTTYQDVSNTCIDCDITVNCKTCSSSPTNCKSCLNGKYLSTPTSGLCVNNCGGSYPYKDIVNFKCVGSCDNNLILNSALSQCQLCPSGQYKKLSDGLCYASCGANYYEDMVNRFCQECDTTCLTCDGGYPQNCTSCKTTTTQKYFLHKMCLSTCPRDLYANDMSGACQVCTVNLHCSTCALFPPDVKCLTCQYGYYYQSDKTCKTTCDQYYYKNTWNHTCQQCDPNCGDCTSANQTSCTNCRNSKYYLSNLTGGYCLTSCPTQGYLTSGTACLQCHFTCLTCNGLSASQCYTCKPGLYKSSGVCRYVCPQKTYPNDTTALCESCNDRCTFCFGPLVSQCVACSSGLFLLNTTCTDSCPANLTANSYNVCYATRTSIQVFLLAIFVVFGLAFN